MSEPFVKYCVNGHPYPADKPRCPRCSRAYLLSEPLCRAIFEAATGEVFPSSMPEWLLSPKGGRMQLDGYSEKLKMAFEYNGSQHYSEHHFFREIPLLELQGHDESKKKLCLERGIILFTIPHTVPRKELKTYILGLLEPTGKIITRDFEIDFKSICPNMIKRYSDMVKDKGRLVSTAYYGAHFPLIWECKKYHQFPSQPAAVASGKWCAVCSKKKRHTIEEARAYAKTMGGFFLSNEYKNGLTKYLWGCDKGHTWYAIGGNVFHGSWCKICNYSAPKTTIYTVEKLTEILAPYNIRCLSREKKRIMKWECIKCGRIWIASVGGTLKHKVCIKCKGWIHTIKEAQDFAHSKGGECLTTTPIIETKTPLLMRCAAKHEWPTNINRIIMQGSWCRTCAGLAKLTIEKMHELAKARGIKCLSTTYVNSSTKLQWECTMGHSWWATPAHIYGGRKCPTCAREKNSERMKAFALQRKLDRLPVSFYPEDLPSG